MATPDAEKSAQIFRQQLRMYDELLRRRVEELDAKNAQNIPLTPPSKVLLQEAINLTSNDRNTAYGKPEDNFQNIADYWNTYLTHRFGGATVGVRFTSQDIAHMMILMKMARLATNPRNRDSLVDIAGYAACAEDCRTNATKTAALDTPVPTTGFDPN